MSILKCSTSSPHWAWSCSPNPPVLLLLIRWLIRPGSAFVGDHGLSGPPSSRWQSILHTNYGIPSNDVFVHWIAQSRKTFSAHPWSWPAWWRSGFSYVSSSFISSRKGKLPSISIKAKICSATGRSIDFDSLETGVKTGNLSSKHLRQLSQLGLMQTVQFGWGRCWKLRNLKWISTFRVSGSSIPAASSPSSSFIWVLVSLWRSGCFCCVRTHGGQTCCLCQVKSKELPDRSSRLLVGLGWAGRTKTDRLSCSGGSCSQSCRSFHQNFSTVNESNT